MLFACRTESSNHCCVDSWTILAIITKKKHFQCHTFKKKPASLFPLSFVDEQTMHIVYFCQYSLTPVAIMRNFQCEQEFVYSISNVNFLSYFCCYCYCCCCLNTALCCSIISFSFQLDSLSRFGTCTILVHACTKNEINQIPINRYVRQIDITNSHHIRSTRKRLKVLAVGLPCFDEYKFKTMPT